MRFKSRGILSTFRIEENKQGTRESKAGQAKGKDNEPTDKHLSSSLRVRIGFINLSTHPFRRRHVPVSLFSPTNLARVSSPSTHRRVHTQICLSCSRTSS